MIEVARGLVPVGDIGGREYVEVMHGFLGVAIGR